MFDFNLTELKTSFIGNEGHEWYPRVDCRVIMEYERGNGEGLIQSVMEVLTLVVEAEESGKPTDFFKAFGKIFPSITVLSRFLYAGCQSGPNEPPLDNNGAELTAEEFTSRIGSKEFIPAMLCAASCLIKFFPKVEDTLEVHKMQSRAEEEKEGSDPTE